MSNFCLPNYLDEENKMNDMTYVDRVKKHFRFLESEFDFTITVASNSEIRSQTDGLVRYATDTTAILIGSETGYASVRLTRVVDGEKYYLTPVDIHEYLNTTDMEKELLLSTNPKDQPAASALFNQKFLLNQPDWKGNKGTIQDLEKELENFSKWLNEHAKLCLEGDFSQWPKFYEYKVHRARADHLRRGKDELGYARVTDADGNHKLIKQSIFKDRLDHVEKLKRDLSG
jgi:hypothetical protein